MSQLSIILLVSSPQLEILRTLFKQNKASLTRPRQVVFELLQDQEPQSIKELIKKSNRRIDRASIYRTLRLFEKLGVVQRVSTGWKHEFELSDAFAGHHHHLHCASCGQTFSLEAGPMLETMIDSVAAKAQFYPRTHQLEIYGLCQKCRGKLT